MNVTSRSDACWRRLLAITVLAFCGALVAQDPENGEAATQPSEMEEIVVKGTKPGDVKRAEIRQIERLRAQLLKDFKENEELEAKYGWRETNVIKRSPSRFKWGYDEQEEIRMRRQIELANIQWQDIQPVSVFQIKF